MIIRASFGFHATIEENAMARQKKGFIWMNEGGDADGVQTPTTRTWAGPGTFYMESIYIFLGAFPVEIANVDGVAPSDIIDLNIGIYHTDGNVITFAHADRYSNTAGIADVSLIRNFVTPWKFSEGEGIVTHPYANGGPGKQWGIMVIAEGYTLGGS